MPDQTVAEPTMIYSVALKIHHPTEDPEIISGEIGLQPHFAWKVGQPQTAPDGAALPGLNQETYWGLAERVEDHRRFFETVVDLIGRLEAAADYIRGLLASGGRARVSVSLPGQVNIGDSLAAADLVRMGRLGVALDVEVFPDMR